jgi:hypothetical protein
MGFASAQPILRGANDREANAGVHASLLVSVPIFSIQILMVVAGFEELVPVEWVA